MNIAISELGSSRVWSSVAYSFIWEGENVWLGLTPTMDACMDRHTYIQAGRQAGKTLLKPGWIDSNFWILGKREGARAEHGLQVETGYWYCVCG